jgi:hypothetical protein
MADDPNVLMHAYGAAAQAGDQEAMQDLHGRILEAYKAQPKPSPVDDSAAGNFGLGLQHSVIRGGEGLGNMAGLGKLFPKTMSDEALKNEDEQAKPLMDTTAGKVGDITGQVASMAVPGTGTAKLANALRVAKDAPSLLKLASMLGRTGVAAGENAVQSAAMADPDKQGEAAKEGAVLGTALHGVGGAAGAVTRGLVGKTPAAEALMQDADEAGKDLFIPISQGGKGPLKAVYQHALPYALGAGEQLDKQSDKALATSREILAENSTPTVEDASGQLNKLKAPIGNTPQQTAADLRTQFDQEYETKLKTHAFNAPSDFAESTSKGIQAQFPELPVSHANQIAATIDQRLQEYAKDGHITGGNLQEAMGAARDDLEQLRLKGIIRSPPAIEAGLDHMKGIVDKEIAENQAIVDDVKASPADKASASETVRDLKNYQRLGGQYKEMAPVAEASEAYPAQRGAFPPGAVAKRAASGTRAQSIDQDMVDVFGEDAGSATPAGRHLLHVVPEALGAGVAGGLASHGNLLGLGLIGAGNLAATKTFQKGLYGDTSAQQALAAALRGHPDAAYQLGLAGRSGIDASRQ